MLDIIYIIYNSCMFNSIQLTMFESHAFHMANVKPQFWLKCTPKVIHITFILIHLADATIQSDLQMRNSASSFSL